MDIQAALNILNGLEDTLDGYCELSEEGKQCFDLAFEALEYMERSLAYSKSVGDMVSKQAVQNMLDRAQIISDSSGEYSGYCTEDIDLETLLTEKIKTGKWINTSYHGKQCSACGHFSEDLVAHYCSWCGAKMRTAT